MTAPLAPIPASPGAGPDDPRRWLGSSAVVDLEDTRLRLRARSLTQLCKNEREKALAIYGFVKRIPFGKPLKLRLRTAREVIDAGRGDAPDKAAVLVALLRLAGIPARLHYYELNGDILRGLTSGVARASRPFAEIWLGERWVCTDTYIFDAAYMAAARDRLRANNWEWGYGFHRAAQQIWNGRDPAYLGGQPPDADPLVLQDKGLFNDPGEFLASSAFEHGRIVRAAHWNMLAPMMDRVIRELREETRAAAQGDVKKAS